MARIIKNFIQVLFRCRTSTGSQRLMLSWTQVVAMRILLLSIFFTAVSICQAPCLLARSSITKSPEDFSQYVLELAQKEYPKLAVAGSDSPLTLKWNKNGSISLDNLYKQVRNCSGDAQIRNEVRRFLAVMNNVPPDDGKPKSWEEIKTRIRPQIFPRDYLQQEWIKNNIVFKPLSFSKDLMEGYVIDSDSAFQYVLKSNLKHWNVSIETVKKTAYENLVSATTKNMILAKKTRNRDSRGKYLEISVNDGYAAARLLLPNVRGQIEAELGKPCYVAIPNRDFLLAWSLDMNETDKFEKQVVRKFHFRDHPLSPEIYALVNSKIEKKESIESSRETSRSLK